jgi:hypothetical protein
LPLLTIYSKEAKYSSGVIVIGSFTGCSNTPLEYPNPTVGKNPGSKFV